MKSEKWEVSGYLAANVDPQWGIAHVAPRNAEGDGMNKTAAREVAGKVRAYLEKEAPDFRITFPITVLDGEIRMEDDAYWYVPVLPSVQPKNTTDYYGLLAEIKTCMLMTDDINVTLVPTLPDELPTQGQLASEAPTKVRGGSVMFEGETVRLRAYSKDDLPKARAYLNEGDTSALMRGEILFPLRMEDEEKWFASLNANSDKKYSFAIEAKKDDTYLGGCGVEGIDAKNRHAMVGLFLGQEHCGKGYGTDALRVLVAFCFDEINLNKVKLGVFSFNKRAIRCYEKVGFKTEGVLRQEIYRYGKYHDGILMGILRSEWRPAKRRKAR